MLIYYHNVTMMPSTILLHHNNHIDSHHQDMKTSMTHQQSRTGRIGVQKVCLKIYPSLVHLLTSYFSNKPHPAAPCPPTFNQMQAELLCPPFAAKTQECAIFGAFLCFGPSPSLFIMSTSGKTIFSQGCLLTN